MRSLVATLVVTVLALTVVPTAATAQTFSLYAAEAFDPNPGTGAGDLSYEWPCGIDASIPSWYDIRVNAVLTVDSAEIINSDIDGTGSGIYKHNAVFDASTSDRQVNCSANVYEWTGWYHSWVGFAWQEWTLAGIGPNEVELIFDSFIPEEWINVPGAWDRIDKGDNRGFGISDDYRTWSRYVLRNPGTNSNLVHSGPVHDTGITREFEKSSSLDGSGHFLPAALADTTPGTPYMTAEGQASTSNMNCVGPYRLYQTVLVGSSAMKVRCYGYASNPLVSYAPAIDWDFTVRLTFYNRGVDWSFVDDSRSDGFPNYQVHLNAVRIADHSHDGDILRLFPPMEISYYQGGAIR